MDLQSNNPEPVVTRSDLLNKSLSIKYNNNIAMITAKSRFIRAMRGVNRVHFHDTVDPNDYFATYTHDDEIIKFSEDDFLSINQKIKYIDIDAATCFADNHAIIDGVVLILKNKNTIK